MKKRIGIDLDSTVADYMGGVVPLLKEHYNLEPNYDIDAYTIEEVFGLTRETRPEGMRELLYEKLHAFKNLPVIEGMDRFTWHLADQDVKIYFITARSGTHTIRQDTFAWLENNRFAFDDVFFTDQKADLCSLMNVKVMMDDELKQIKSLQEAGIDVVVPACAWNKNLPVRSGPGKTTRVENWQQALQAVEEFLL